MKIVNLIWGFSLGAGIDKCYLIYAGLGEMDRELKIVNVCIDIRNLNSHIEPLDEIGATLIRIKNRKDFSWIRKLYRLLVDEKPDVVFTHGFNGAIMMLIERICHGVKLRLICSYHGAYHAPTPLKKLVAPVYNLLPIAIYKHLAYKVICVSRFSAGYLASKGVPPDKIATVHNGIKSDHITARLELPDCMDGAVTLLTASRISEEKGLSYLLDALKLLKGRGVRFHYYMVGEGPDSDMLKKRIHESGLCDIVSTVGFQDNVDQWMAACDIFVLPSLHENHSIAVLEAMRAGKPIVATDVGGNGESIVDNVSGLLVPPKDPVGLSEALFKVISDDNLRKVLGRNAQKRFLEFFTEDLMRRNLIKVLKS